MVNPYIIPLAVLIAFIIIDSIPKIGNLITNVLLLLFFWWALANKALPAEQAIFYTIGAVIILVLSIPTALLKTNFSSESASIFGLKFKGFAFAGLTVVLGLIIFGMMKALQAGKPEAAIIGVPTLAILGATFTQTFSTITVGVLGIIENRAFFSILGIVGLLFKGIIKFVPLFAIIEIITPMIGTIIIASMFAIFHYAIFALSSLVFAFAVFIIFTASFLLLKDDTPANIAHYLWNISIQIGRSVKLV